MSSEKSDSTASKRSRVSSKSTTPEETAEELSEVANLIERRRMQNRISQRNYRNKIRVRLEKLEAMFDSQNKEQLLQAAEHENQDSTMLDADATSGMTSDAKAVMMARFASKDTPKKGFDTSLDNLDFYLAPNGTDSCPSQHMQSFLSSQFADSDLSSAATDASTFQFIDPMHLPGLSATIMQQPQPTIPMMASMGDIPKAEDVNSGSQDSRQTSPLTPPLLDSGSHSRESSNATSPFPLPSPILPIYNGGPYGTGMPYALPGTPHQGQCVLVPMMVMNVPPQWAWPPRQEHDNRPSSCERCGSDGAEHGHSYKR